MKMALYGEKLCSSVERNIVRVSESATLYRVLHPIMGWKKLQETRHNYANPILAGVEIPKNTYLTIPDTVFTSRSLAPDTRKMRASQMICRSMEDMNRFTDNPFRKHTQAHSSWERDYIYYLNQLARPSLAFDIGTDTCGPGLHFYLNELDARKH